jgi:C-terminal processing protease CtpA/Prc
MEAIRPYSLETGFTDPVDRFSFAIEKKDWDAMSTGMSSVSASSAADGDIGLSALFLSEGDLRVRLVEPESPAGRAGIRRGWRITKVNDNSNITTANATFLVDNIYNAASVSLTFVKPDGSSEKINLSRAHYSEKPVYMDTVFKHRKSEYRLPAAEFFFGQPG